MPTTLRPFAHHRPTRFLPPLLWMGLITLGSSGLLSGDRTGPWVLALLGHLMPWASPATLYAIHFGLRKLGHLTEFGILAVLWHRSLMPWPGAVTAAFVFATAYGGLDELRQGLEPSRVPSLADVVLDALGAWLGLTAWTEAASLRARTLRAAAWGVGLVAGLGVLGVALDASLGRPAGDASVAALGLSLVATGLARLARHARSRIRPGASGGP